MTKRKKYFSRDDKLQRIRKKGFNISFYLEADDQYRGRIRATKDGQIIIGTVNQVYGYLFSGM